MIKRLIAFVVVMAGMAPCDAHVKWFSRMAACGGKPLPPHHVFSSKSFVELYALSAAAMLLVFFIDARIARTVHPALRYARSLPVLSSEWRTEILRFGTAASFALMSLYFWSSPIILTPELKAAGAGVGYLQLSIAVLLLFRRTVWLASLGIVALYVFSISRYGMVHLLDYVFFLGIAAHLVIGNRNSKDHFQSGLAFLRLATGASFLWVSVEKWAYPSWTYEILRFQLKPVLMGFPPEFVATAAGFVEFCLAFALITGRLSARVAAAFLLALLILAIPLVGTIDAIGHFPLIVILVLLAGTNNTIPLPDGPGGAETETGLPRVSRVGLPRSAVYCASVPMLTVAYYLVN